MTFQKVVRQATHTPETNKSTEINLLEIKTLIVGKRKGMIKCYHSVIKKKIRY